VLAVLVAGSVMVATAGACTAVLGNDFTIEEGSGGAGAMAGSGASTSTSPADGGGGVSAANCENMARDGGETDIDCGGPCETKCALGRGCMLDSDCVSDNCGPMDVCVPPPPCGGACASWQTCEMDVCTPSAVFYVNLEGGSFSYGLDDDASLSIQQVSNEALPANMAGYGGTVFDQDAIFNAVVANFDAYNVEVTRVRPPATTPYQMVVVTPDGSPLVPLQKIWAPPADCGDQDDNNMAFVIFSSQSNAAEGVTPYSQAVVVSKTFGILAGLEPVNGSSDIMHVMISGAPTRTFEDFCHAQPTSVSWTCTTEHMVACNGNPGLQNAHAELLALYGARP
jgi:hypothetical protein